MMPVPLRSRSWGLAALALAVVVGGLGIPSNAWADGWRHPGRGRGGFYYQPPPPPPQFVYVPAAPQTYVYVSPPLPVIGPPPPPPPPSFSPVSQQSVSVSPPVPATMVAASPEVSGLPPDFSAAALP